MSVPKRLRLMETQARRVLSSRFLDLSSRHKAKSGDGLDKIHSIATFQRYSQALGQAGKWCRQKYGLLFIAKMTPDMAMAYLEHRKADGIGQKQLDNDRLSMQRIVGKLERVKTDKPQKLETRAYSGEQAMLVAERQHPRNALVTKLIFNSGLRAHELLTIKRADEAEPTTARQWRPDLFHGRLGVRYVVIGKGGLSREVMINQALAQELEARRLPEPIDAKDRQINYPSRCYDIGGGQAWSQSFSKISRSELGWSKRGAWIAPRLCP